MRATQEQMLAEMRRWGYRLVVTPSLESLDVLALGLEPEQRRRLFKLTDSDGSVLALVGEQTVPVARLAAGRLRSSPLPLRLCYAGRVLTNRPGRLDGRRESHQVGAELIGAPGPVADAEVIAMAVGCLDGAGLRRYQIDIGHAGFFGGLLEGLPLPAAARSAVRQALARRDLVALEEVLAATPLRSAEHELLLRFPALRGGPEILQAAGGLVRNGRAERALEELQRLHGLLRIHGLGEAVALDLGAIRDFDYYTGVIFEGYAWDAGRPLAQGGRYDRLLARFGRPAPATGFTVHLDLLGELLQRMASAPELTRLDVALAWRREGLEEAIRLAGSLRMFGLRTVAGTEARGLAGARRWADPLGARHLLWAAGAGHVHWAPAGGRLRRLPAAQAVARIVGGPSR